MRLRNLLKVTTLVVAAFGCLAGEAVQSAYAEGAVPLRHESRQISEQLARVRKDAAKSGLREQALIGKELKLLSQRLAALDALARSSATPQAMARYRDQVSELRKQSDELYQSFVENGRQHVTAYLHEDIADHLDDVVRRLEMAGFRAEGFPKQRTMHSTTLDGFPASGEAGALSPLANIDGSVIFYRPGTRAEAEAIRRSLAGVPGIGPIAMRETPHPVLGRDADDLEVVLTGK